MLGGKCAAKRATCLTASNISSNWKRLYRTLGSRARKPDFREYDLFETRIDGATAIKAVPLIATGFKERYELSGIGTESPHGVGMHCDDECRCRAF